MGKTKKVKTAGRFKARYGVGIRKRVLKIEPKQRLKHVCPACGFRKVKRIASGVFRCRKCSNTFAGGAYLPVTMTGAIVKKIISQKAFGAMATEMLEGAEAVEEKFLETAGSKEENKGVEKRE